MMEDREQLKSRIETWLFARGEWVSEAELLSEFQIGERALREVENEPGLLTEFAISRKTAGGGYKHISLATTAEWLRYSHSEFNAAIRRLRRVRLQRKRRALVQRPRSIFPVERDTGQGLLFPVERRTA
jgi:hypothetical protein